MPCTAGEQAFGGESEAAADRCDRTGGPVRPESQASGCERPASEGTKKKRSERRRLRLKDKKHIGPMTGVMGPVRFKEGAPPTSGHQGLKKDRRRVEPYAESIGGNPAHS